MTADLTHILIFKTNVTTFSDKLRVQQLFAANDAVEDWNVDSEDVDCVLRVVSHEWNAQEIISKLEAIGFDCCELE